MWGGPVDGCEVMLFWSPSSDDVEPPQFIVYNVYVNGQRIDTVSFGQTQVIEYGIADGPNLFQVIASDSAGNASAPAAATFDLIGCVTPGS